jgi:predicted CXXCH cytochrome family protein
MRSASRLRASFVAAAALAAVAVSAAVRDAPAEEPGAVTLPRAKAPADCAWCHKEACERWERSAHALSTRAVSRDTVPLEVAAETEVVHDPGRSRFFGRGDAFEIESVGDDGRPRRWPLEWVVGVRRMTMLVARMDDGRLQVAPAMREEPNGLWFDYTHLLFGAEPAPVPVVRPGEPSFWTGPDRSFDVLCGRCHMSGRKALAPKDGKGPRSEFRAPGVDCEACHGDGRAHGEHWRKPGAKRDDDPIPRIGGSDRAAALAACLPCHVEGEVLDPRALQGPGVTTDPLEAIEPTMLDHLARVDATGRPLELMYEGLALLTSKCAERGKLTCSTCHVPHGNAFGASLRVPLADDRTLCAACHAEICAKPKAHSHHAPDSTGTWCASCHLPPVPVERGHGGVRDHTIGVPRLPRDGEVRTQDACTWCHTGARHAPFGVKKLDRAAMADAYAQWWPKAKDRPSWARVIDAARANDPACAEELTLLAQDPRAPRLVRASALRMLGKFEPEGGGRIEGNLVGFARNDDVVLRRAALHGLGDVRSPDADAALLRGLADPSSGVRFTAARAALRGWERVKASKPLLAACLPVLAEDAAASPEEHLRWFRLGAARQIAGDAKGAIEAYERKLALDPQAKAVRETVQRLRKGGK